LNQLFSVGGLLNNKGKKNENCLRTFKQALVEDGIPATSFGVDDLQAEYSRLCAVGVHFTQPPVSMGPVTMAVLDDTCGNLVQIAQKTSGVNMARVKGTSKAESLEELRFRKYYG